MFFACIKTKSIYRLKLKEKCSPYQNIQNTNKFIKNDYALEGNVFQYILRSFLKSVP